MMHTDDTAFITAELDNRFGELVAYLYPGAPQIKGKVYPSAKGKDLGSFEIVVQGPKAGTWYRHSQGVGGGSLKLLAYATFGHVNLTREVFDEARRFLGIERRALSDDEKRRREEMARRVEAEAAARRRAAEAQAAADAEKMREVASHIWETSQPIEGTAAARYLVNRLDEAGRGDVRIPWPADLRFHPSVWHSEYRESTPALVAAIRDVPGEFMSVHRIWVTDDGRKRYPGESGKMAIGGYGGGAVRLFDPIDGAIATCEGIETGLAVWLMTGRAVWPCLSTSGLVAFEPPFGVSRVACYADGDLGKWDRDRGVWRKAPGREAALRHQANMIAAGVDCTVHVPDVASGKTDWLDVWTALRKRGVL